MVMVTRPRSRPALLLRLPGLVLGLALLLLVYLSSSSASSSSIGVATAATTGTTTTTTTTTTIEGRLSLPPAEAAASASGACEITLRGTATTSTGTSTGTTTGTTTTGTTTSAAPWVRSTLARQDGTFAFDAVPEGVYVLDVSSPTLVFPQVKLRVSPADATSAATSAATSSSSSSLMEVQAVQYAYAGAVKQPAAYPVVLSPLVRASVFDRKEQLSVWRMVSGNPMAVMMVVSLGIMFLMPKMMEGMDPEALKELQAQQAAAGGDPLKGLQAALGLQGAGAGAGGRNKAEDDD